MTANSDLMVHNNQQDAPIKQYKRQGDWALGASELAVAFVPLQLFSMP